MSGPAFGQWLKARRQQHDLTQQALADQLDCSVATIRKIESGQRRPSRQLVTQLGAVLQLPIDEVGVLCRAARGNGHADPSNDQLLHAEPGPLKHSVLPTPSGARQTVRPLLNL
jgi:transcriptional regulator with XRE-family HTH domain